MTKHAELLTATEAAVVSRVSLRDINRVIDEQLLPIDFLCPDRGRVVLACGCPLISFYFESAKRLTADERLFAMEHVGQKLRAPGFVWSQGLKDDWTIHDDFLTIDLQPFLRAVLARLDHLEAAKSMICRSPVVLGGTPVIKATRVPVYDVAASLAAGMPVQRVLEAYPAITAMQLDLVRIYAEAYPPRGRPRREATIPEGAIIVADRRIPRRKTG